MFISLSNIVVFGALALFYCWTLNKAIKSQSEEIKEQRERANAYESAVEELANMVIIHREAIDRLGGDAFDLALTVESSDDYAAIKEAASRYQIFKLTY